MTNDVQATHIVKKCCLFHILNFWNLAAYFTNIEHFMLIIAKIFKKWPPQMIANRFAILFSLVAEETSFSPVFVSFICVFFARKKKQAQPSSSSWFDWWCSHYGCAVHFSHVSCLLCLIWNLDDLTQQTMNEVKCRRVKMVHRHQQQTNKNHKISLE